MRLRRRGADRFAGPMKRPFAVRLHQCLGLTLGLLWALQGLTGALFVYSREVDRLSGPPVVDGPPASLDAVLASGLAANGGRRVTRIAATDSRGDLLALYYTDAGGAPKAVLVEATSARAVGTRELSPPTPFSGSASRWLYVTHMSLNAGRTGEVFIGLSGVLLLTSVIAGVCSAWPRAGRWAAAFAPGRWKTPQMRLFGWHRAIGLVVCACLATLAVSGAYLSFPAQVRTLAAKVVPYQASYSPMAMGGPDPMEVLRGKMPAHAPPAHGGAIPVGPQRAVEIALERFPRAHWVRVFLPTPSEPVISVRLRQPGEARAWIGVTSVAVDPVSGTVVDVYDPFDAPLSNRIFDVLFSIHNGEIAGPVGRTIVLLVGLSLPVFYVTGVWAWLRRRRVNRVRQTPADDRAPRLRAGSGTV